MVDMRSLGHPDSTTLAKTTGRMAKENVAREAQLAKGSFAGERVVVVKNAGSLANEAQEADSLASDEVARELRQQGRRIVPEDQPATGPKVSAHGRSMASGRGLRGRHAAARQFSNRVEDNAEKAETEISTGDSAVTALASRSEAEEHLRRPSDLEARKDEIEALGRAMQAAGLTDPGDIIEFVRKHLGEHPGRDGGNDDPTLQYGALVIIQEMFAAERQETLAEAVGGAATRLLAEHGLEIQKGTIVTDAAALYASERFGSVSNLRSLYMEQVVAHKGIPATYNAIVEKYGEAGFADAVGFLLRAAGDDLAEMTVDIDLARQKDVLDNLYQLEVLNTIREKTDGLLQEIGKHYPVASAATPLKVIRQTFELIENPGRVGQPTISRIARETVPESVEGRIAFLREYRGLASMFPLKIFDQAEEGGAGVRLRERLADAIVAAQDVADAEEAEKLGS